MNSPKAAGLCLDDLGGIKTKILAETSGDDLNADRDIRFSEPRGHRNGREAQRRCGKQTALRVQQARDRGVVGHVEIIQEGELIRYRHDEHRISAQK